MDLSSADSGNRVREEEGDDGGDEVRDTKRARGEGEDGEVSVDEEGMVTDEPQSEGTSSAAQPAPTPMDQLVAAAVAQQHALSGHGDDHDSISDAAAAPTPQDSVTVREWLELECRKRCYDCSLTDRRRQVSQPMPDDGHLCDGPTHASDLSWDGILNDRQLVPDLKAAVQAMRDQQYWDGMSKRVFEITPEVEQRLDGLLDLQTWVWVKTNAENQQNVDRFCDLPDFERQELEDMERTVGMQQMAAIRPWTDEGLDLYKVATSVSDRATSVLCLEKILPYIRLLYDGLCRLPKKQVDLGKKTYVFSGKLHRGEKFIRPAFRDPLPKGRTVEFNTFTSFTTDPAKAAEFKNGAFLPALHDFGSGLISADANYTLEERLTMFFEHHACDDCYYEFMPREKQMAEEFKDEVEVLKQILGTRFPFELEDPEKPSRTVIVVEDGVGYRLGNLSVMPQEDEVLMEPGACLEVVEDNRFVAAQYKEQQSKFLKLTTVTARGLSLMTIKDGTPFESPAKVKEGAARTRRHLREDFEAKLLELDGEDLTNADSYWRRILEDQGGGAAARDKGAAAQTTRGSRLPNMRGMTLNEECNLQMLKQQLRDEVHDFDGACDWLLQVTVRQHNGKADDEGKRVDSSKVNKAKAFRLYTVDAGQLLKVTVRNLSQDREITFTPVYMNEDGEEEPEESVTLKAGGERYELPYPLEKKEGEKEDSWGLKDKSGKTLLRLRFALLQTEAAGGGGG